MSGQFAEPEPEFESSHQHHQQSDHEEVHDAATRRVPPQTMAQLEAQADVAPDMAQAALEQADGTDVETRNERRLTKRKASVITHGENAVALYSQAQEAQANGALEAYPKLLDEALNEIQDCTRQIERALNLIHVPAEREGYFSEVRKYYPVKIQILMALHNEDGSAGYDVQAFEVSEGSRARLHNEQLVRSGMGSREGVNPALLFEERALLRIEARTPEEELRLQELQEQIKNRPYQNVEYRDPLKLAEIQNEVLDEDTALIYYSVQSDTKIFIWIVTQQSFFTHEIDLSEIESMQRGLVSMNRTMRRNINNLSPGYTVSASALGEALIQPLLENLQAENCSRISIATEGSLNTLPFASILLPDGSPDGKFLVEDYEIVYLTSATSIAISRKQAQDQVAELDPESVGVFLVDQFPSSTYYSLPAIPHEGAHIQSHNPSNTEVFTDNEATGENLLNATGAFTILHVATHGVCRSDQLEHCGLILRDGSQGVDRLTLPEIPSTEIRMSTQLMVLSACETALGGSGGGHGEFVSIAHTFAENGIPRVVGTLWEISDTGTMLFMKHFYEALFQENKSPSAALQHAQKKMITIGESGGLDPFVEYENGPRDYKGKKGNWVSNHPFYWAAFKLVGDWQWPPNQ